uniref:DDE-1 domain-containing protein n=1 Tax=Timema cristinae TaxID=61476 RepID=A0A7R9CFK9_TIMCR|nr:unnamed protein product [Timema cristinae]
MSADRDAHSEYIPPQSGPCGKKEHLMEWRLAKYLGGSAGVLYGVTESGLMQDYIFEKWLNAFVNQVKYPEKPVLVLFDEHGSHVLTYKVTCAARDNIDKAIFPTLLKKLVASSFKADHVVGGFKGSGIYPFEELVMLSSTAEDGEIEGVMPVLSCLYGIDT